MIDSQLLIIIEVADKKIENYDRFTKENQIIFVEQNRVLQPHILIRQCY